MILIHIQFCLIECWLLVHETSPDQWNITRLSLWNNIWNVECEVECDHDKSYLRPQSNIHMSHRPSYPSHSTRAMMVNHRIFCIFQIHYYLFINKRPPFGGKCLQNLNLFQIYAVFKSSSSLKFKLSCHLCKSNFIFTSKRQLTQQLVRALNLGQNCGIFFLSLCCQLDAQQRKVSYFLRESNKTFMQWILRRKAAIFHPDENWLGNNNISWGENHCFLLKVIAVVWRFGWYISDVDCCLLTSEIIIYCWSH